MVTSRILKHGRSRLKVHDLHKLAEQYACDKCGKAHIPFDEFVKLDERMNMVDITRTMVAIGMPFEALLDGSHHK